jgi:hypothetical protein
MSNIYIALKKTRLLFFIATFLLFVVSAHAQNDDGGKVSTESTTTDSLSYDSLSGHELAPLDIPENRGLYILTPDKQMQLRIMGSIRYSMVFDNNINVPKSGMLTYFIPTGSNNKHFLNYYNGLTQTRFGFEILRQTKGGQVFARLETDFAGINGFRIRHAYGQYNRIIVGQTWSLFSQAVTTPATVDFEGPTASVAYRSPQLRYSFPKEIKGFRFATAFEYKIPELTIPDTLSITSYPLIPNVTFKMMKKWDKGYWQLSGLFPVHTGRVGKDTLVFKEGWGFVSSGYFDTWEKGRWYLQGVIGQGVASSITDLSGHGLDVITTPQGEGYSPLAYGGLIAYEQHWNPNIFTNIILAAVNIESLSYAPADSYNWGYTIRANTFWNIVEGMRLGSEVVWGQRMDKNGQTGDALRFNALFYYDF